MERQTNKPADLPEGVGTAVVVFDNGAIVTCGGWLVAKFEVLSINGDEKEEHYGARNKFWAKSTVIDADKFLLCRSLA